MRLLLIVLVFLNGSKIFAQDTLLWREAYTLRYENDLFAGRDQYYSQGIFLQYDHFEIDLGWLNKFFLKVPGIQRSLQTGVTQKVYTPSSITSDSLLVGDRPYAATYGYTVKFSSRSKSKNYILSWSLHTGWIGKPAFGKETQTTIHRWTKNTKPLGWEHQLNTGLSINLSFEYLKTWFTKTKWLRVEGISSTTIGTLINETRLSGMIKVGYLCNEKQYFLFYHPAVRAVVYDGTLQGSLLSKPSEARVSGSQISRLVSEQEFGFKIQYRKFGCSAYGHFQSKLFKNATNHAWGGIGFSYSF